MKLELRIDVDVRTSSWLRRALLLGVPLAAMALTGSVFGVPNHFESGKAVKASEMNANFDALDARIDAVVPPGTVIAFAGPVIGQPPPGWLFCDGAAVSRATYAKLFDAIGTTAGSGDGSTTFNLPDYRGRFLRGADLGQGRDPEAGSRTAMTTGGNTGDAVNTVEGDAFSIHNHGGSTGPINNIAGGGVTNYLDYTSGGNQAAFFYTQTAANPSNQMSLHTHSIPNAGGSMETRPKNAAVNYLVKI